MATQLMAPVGDQEEKVKSLEEIQRATLNILEDFDEEKKRLEVVQTAALNLLEDFGEEKKRLEQVQTATLNILEDFDAEKARLEQSQRALLNILEDIDVEKAKVAKAYQQLEAVNKELEAFTYSVAHDLRAPLRHIDAFSRILAEEARPHLPPQATQYLERILQATRQMGQLVEDLLNLSRVGRKELSLQVTGLNSLVEEVLANLRPEMEARQIEWKVGKLPFVEADPALLKQVFANLLSNAVKYTRPRDRAVIEVGSRTFDGASGIFVRDNGVGFSMKYADKLFGIFQRLHRQEDFEGRREESHDATGSGNIAGGRQPGRRGVDLACPPP